MNSVDDIRSYIPWRDRFAPPYLRMKGTFVAAADQATRYGRQMASMNTVPTETNGNSLRVFYAWQHFISQFEGNTREVLTRTFWQAFYS